MMIFVHEEQEEEILTLEQKDVKDYQEVGK